MGVIYGVKYDFVGTGLLSKVLWSYILDIYNISADYLNQSQLMLNSYLTIFTQSGVYCSGCFDFDKITNIEFSDHSRVG